MQVRVALSFAIPYLVFLMVIIFFSFFELPAVEDRRQRFTSAEIGTAEVSQRSLLLVFNFLHRF